MGFRVLPETLNFKSLYRDQLCSHIKYKENLQFKSHKKTDIIGNKKPYNLSAHHFPQLQHHRPLQSQQAFMLMLFLSCVSQTKHSRKEEKKWDWSAHSTDLIFIRRGFKSLQQTTSEGKWEHGSKNQLLPLLEKRDGGGHQEGEIMENLCSLWEALLAGFNSLNSGKISAGNTRALTCPTVWKPDVGGKQQMHNKWTKPSGYGET